MAWNRVQLYTKSFVQSPPSQAPSSLAAKFERKSWKKLSLRNIGTKRRPTNWLTSLRRTNQIQRTINHSVFSKTESVGGMKTQKHVQRVPLKKYDLSQK